MKVTLVLLHNFVMTYGLNILFILLVVGLGAGTVYFRYRDNRNQIGK